MTLSLSLSQALTESRGEALGRSLQAQQYFSDAQEAESWMKEKEPLVSSGDYGKDEDSAQVRPNSLPPLREHTHSLSVCL